MKREYGPDDITRSGESVLTVGTFDGVHAGHRAILQYLVQRARERDGTSTVVTFDPHPREILQDRLFPLLTTVEERGDMLEAMGIKRLVVWPFTKDFSNLEAREYVRKVLVDTIGFKEIVVGYDHRFGKDRTGDAELLREMGKELDFALDVMPPQLVDQSIVSSTRIRELLMEEGDVRTAGQLLMRPYALTGKVVEGDRRGRQIGFPTANLEREHARKVVPCEGVYAVRAERLATGEQHEGMMNIGTRPTFDDADRQLEVHLFNFEEELYGEKLRVQFVQRIRDEQKFDGADALIEQLSRDRARCKRALAELS